MTDLGLQAVNAICNTLQLCFMAWISYRLQATHSELLRVKAHESR